MTELKAFSREHLDAVCALERDIFAGRDPWSRMAFEGELINPQAIWVVAVGDGRPVGYAGGWAGGEEFHLLNLGVAAASRRTGVGRSLVIAVLDRAVARGCRRATLEVRAENAAARRLYESMGFVSAGVRPGHYGNGEDAVVYWLNPIPRTTVSEV